MRSLSQPACFTRVVLDGIEGVEIAQLHAIEGRIRACLQHIPDAQRLYISNALLNLAIARLLAGSSRTNKQCDLAHSSPVV